MAVASWMLRSRTLRSGRFERSRKENDEDAVKIDLSKDVHENCYELLEGICRNSEMSEGKRLNYLNSFVKLIVHIKGNLDCTGFNIEDILWCLRISLVHQSTQVRAGGLRAVRHLLQTEADVQVLNSLQYPQLIARSLDVVLRNEVERIQALKLIRKTLVLSPSHFDVAVARSLVSLANGVTEEKDRMLRACLAALCELAVLNPELFTKCGGVTAITRNILDCQMPRIVECLCGVLLHLLHAPETRAKAHIDLFCLAAPYCDFHYRHAWMDKNRDERELRFNCSRLALLSVLRSWPGILHFCSPRNASGLHAIVQVLYLDQLEVRKAVLDLLYELLGLPQPEWTDEYSVALNAVDPSDPQDCWRLGEGFVAAEGRTIMPHLARCTPNIADIHLAVLLYVFLEAGLLGALVEVIVSSDTFISVRATVLLGELLHLIHALLPPECCDVSPALPGLLSRTHNGRHQALAAVTALNQLHALLKHRPASSSLYLDHILRAGRRLSCTGTGERCADCSPRERSPPDPGGPQDKAYSSRRRLRRNISNTEGLSMTASLGDSAFRESGVLQSKEGFHTWNWNVIGAILRREGENALRLDDSNHRLFLRRLVHYYQPSSNRYSHLDLAMGGSSDRQTHIHTAVGCELVRCLLAMLDQPESTKLLIEWFTDISNHIDAITTSKSAHDCLFSPQHMATTQCQTYFLFIGYMCHTPRGVALLQDVGIFKKLASLATTTNHSCYVKLIVSSFDYASDGPHRAILSRVLTCKQESSRLYATQFLLVLLRAGVLGFERWGVELLVKQLSDQSRVVVITALNILHEACEKRACLERLVELRPDLSHLGEKGLLLLIRLLSLPRGFRVLGGGRFVTAEISRWAEHFIYKYVHLIEAELLDSLTLHQRSEDGRYDRRHSSTVRWQGVRRDVYMPPHLYGQLSQHEQGWSALLDSGRLTPLISLILETAAVKGDLVTTDRQILEIKAALWACGHASASHHGVQKFIDDGIFRAVIEMAETCPIYSLRGTAVYVLGLMGTTFRGANELFSLGWACVRHNRHDRWPVIEEEDWSRVECSNSLRPDSEEDGGTTISSSDNMPAWAIEAWADDVDDPSAPIGRSSTLPATAAQLDGAAQHKRSLSESHRNRDNSISSCESAPSQINNKQQPISVIIHNNNNNNCRLSPIPSSSSLSTLKTGLELMRGQGYWTADGPRRVSLSAHSYSNSNSLTISPPDANGSRLSHQDLLGYTTLRTLRRVRASSFRSDSFTRHLTSSSGGFEDTLIENALFGGPSGTLFSGNTTSERHQVRTCSPSVGQCYMGICLPRQLVRLFPDDASACVLLPHDNWQGIVTSGPVSTEPRENTPAKSLVLERRNSSKHERSTCFLCSVTHKSPVISLVENEESTDHLKLKSDILKHVERLSNPVWTKQSKQALLHLKQRYSSIFQNICLYSEVCNMVSTSGYRLSARRFLQELFLDLNFEDLLSEQNRLMRERLFSKNPCTSAVVVSGADNNCNITKGFKVPGIKEEESASEHDDSKESAKVDQSPFRVKPMLNINKISNLKLTCSENKFPITTRNHTVSTSQSYTIRSSLRSPEFKSLNNSQTVFLWDSAKVTQKLNVKEDET